MTALLGHKPGQNCKDRAARIGLPAQDCKDKATRAEERRRPPEKERHVR